MHADTLNSKKKHNIIITTTSTKMKPYRGPREDNKRSVRGTDRIGQELRQKRKNIL